MNEGREQCSPALWTPMSRKKTKMILVTVTELHNLTSLVQEWILPSTQVVDILWFGATVQIGFILPHQLSFTSQSSYCCIGGARGMWNYRCSEKPNAGTQSQREKRQEDILTHNWFEMWRALLLVNYVSFIFIHSQAPNFFVYYIFYFCFFEWIFFSVPF